MTTKQSMAKDTIRLPEALWKKARIRAIQEGRDAQDIIRNGLELYFERNKPPAAAKGG